MPWLQGRARATQTKHLFHEREAHLKNAGRFWDRQASFFDGRYDTDS
jgi:hypothetical protein